MLAQTEWFPLEALLQERHQRGGELEHALGLELLMHPRNPEPALQLAVPKLKVAALADLERTVAETVGLEPTKTASVQQARVPEAVVRKTMAACGHQKKMAGREVASLTMAAFARRIAGKRLAPVESACEHLRPVPETAVVALPGGVLTEPRKEVVVVPVSQNLEPVPVVVVGLTSLCPGLVDARVERKLACLDLLLPPVAALKPGTRWFSQQR